MNRHGHFWKLENGKLLCDCGKTKELKVIRRSKIKRKKTPARKMKQKIDLAVKASIHERDGHACLRCKKSGIMQAAHVHSKGKYPRLRFEPDNLLTLCYACHIHWAHKEPLEFTDWFRANWPDRADKLQSLKQNAPKVDLKELYWQLTET